MSQLEAVERLEKRLETADLNVMLHKSEIQHTMHLKAENVKMRHEVLCVFLVLGQMHDECLILSSHVWGRAGVCVRTCMCVCAEHGVNGHA